jgi:hypothetical protein
MPLRIMPMKRQAKSLAGIKIPTKNSWKFSAPMQNNVATSVGQPRYLALGTTSVLRLNVHPHVVASARVDRVTWRLMKHWHFSNDLNFNTPTSHRPGD